MAAEWIVPFKGRNDTGVYGQNFIWRSGNLYVMDNHRAAAWCWSQHILSSTAHALVHVDRHNDTLQSQLKTWIEALPNGLPTSIEDYLSVSYNLDCIGQVPLFRWDNYLSIYLELYGANVVETFFATHGEGDKPNHHRLIEIKPFELPDTLENRISCLTLPVILNVDLDYFFGIKDDHVVRILDDDYFDGITSAIAALDKAGKFPVITIALTATDDLTGGWGPVEQLAIRMCAALGHKFELPNV